MSIPSEVSRDVTNNVFSAAEGEIRAEIITWSARPPSSGRAGSRLNIPKTRDRPDNVYADCRLNVRPNIEASMASEKLNIHPKVHKTVH